MSDYKDKIEEKRQETVNRLLEQIKSASLEWEKGWVTVLNGGLPINAESKKRYSGINMLVLWFQSHKKGYIDPRWLTFNQAADLGASIKAGEKASNIFYYSKYDKKTKKAFEEKTIENLSNDEQRQYIKDNVRMILKYYNVFNAEQCDKMPELVKPPEMNAAERKKQNELIENIIMNSAAPIEYKGTEAYYNFTKDKIVLPPIALFDSMNDYYATALHEISHSTMESSRLNRQNTNQDIRAYAVEELRAELACIFLQGELGIQLEGKHFSNHAAYLQNWLNEVKENKDVFFAAASDAGKIANYITENYAKEMNENTFNLNKFERMILENMSMDDRKRYDEYWKNRGDKLFNHTILENEVNYETSVAGEKIIASGNGFWTKVKEVEREKGRQYDFYDIAETQDQPPQFKVFFGMYNYFKLNDLKYVNYSPNDFIETFNNILLKTQEHNLKSNTEEQSHNAIPDSLKASAAIIEHIAKARALNKKDTVPPKEKESTHTSNGGLTQNTEKSSSYSEAIKCRNIERLNNLEKNVPDEMKALNQWCVYKVYYDKETKETKKFILNVNDGHWAKPNESSTWSSFTAALEYARENNCAGLSFALNVKGISCIDLDECMENGKPNKTAERLLGLLPDTYAERSVSGGGIHIFVKDDILQNGKYRNRQILTNGQELEVYDSTRFISMTGNLISKTSQLASCNEELKKTLQKLLGEKTVVSNFIPQNLNNKSDNEVIAQIERSKMGATFKSLYAGQPITGNPSQDDMKLLNILSFFTDCDKSQIERIFKSSALYRPEKEKYLQHSIDKAISTLKTRPTKLNQESNSKQPQK